MQYNIINNEINSNSSSSNRKTESPAWRRRRRPLPNEIFFSVSTAVSFLLSLVLLLFCCCEIQLLSVPVFVSAHVVLVHPTPRTNNDYLFTFEDGVCNPDNSCAALCGDAYDKESNPFTVFQVGVPITLRWKTNVVHEPFRYRLSLNKNAAAVSPGNNNINNSSSITTTIDGGFDLADNILATVDHSEASDPGNIGMTGSFSTTVTIPESALETCGRRENVDNNSQSGGVGVGKQQQPCVLQLWDLYYFVSCANVWLTTEEVDVNEGGQSLAPTPTPPPSSPLMLPTFTNHNTILVRGASFDDYWVTTVFAGREEVPELDPVLYLERCKDYTFLIDAPGHPFVIKTRPGVGPDNVLVFDDGDDNDDEYYSVSDTFPTSEGVEQGTFVFRAGDTAPSRGLFYQCTLHENMFSEIVVVDGSSSSCGAAKGGDGTGGGSHDETEVITSAAVRTAAAGSSLLFVDFVLLVAVHVLIVA